MKFTTENLRELRVAQSIAPKNDARYYLNGILFDFTDKKITKRKRDKSVQCKMVSTNGHMMSRSVVLLEDTQHVPVTQQLILAIEGVILIKAQVAKFDIDLKVDTPIGNVQFFAGGRHLKTLVVRQVQTGGNRGYPDYERVIVPEDRESDGISQIAFNAEYLQRVVKAVGGSYPHAQLKFGGEHDMIDVHLQEIPETKVTLMPCHV